MSKSFIEFIWKYSSRQQLYVLFLTVISFPILYMTLELPKQIINDAIGGEAFPITFMGFSFDQLQYLVFLAFAYLVFVLGGGLLKMHTNTTKGIVGERLLRRFRFQLIRRITRFPLPYFRQTSQGALISMVTAEAEAIGNMMGEAIARPAFAAGQMVTILAFFFVQNFWLGLAAVAMIPIQAYLVPKLQKKINQLNKQRIFKVRKLSEHIGETVAGTADLRANGGIRYALAQFSQRFGEIFDIRLEIYQRKFFMKFLNNTLNQLTPFLLLLIGGYLAINGQLTVGALAAALASYKDLLGPWRDLLAYYSQIQDTSVRYQTITEQFNPHGMVDEALYFDEPSQIPSLAGDINLSNVSINDQFGMPVLSAINTKFPKGAMVSVCSQNAAARQCLSHLISRTALPATGSVEIGGHDISTLHQRVLSSRIGVVEARPFIFNGGIERNAQMSLWHQPDSDYQPSASEAQHIHESELVGNSADLMSANWLDPSVAGFETTAEVRAWWAKIIKEVGFEAFLVNRALTQPMVENRHPQLKAQLVRMRPAIQEALTKAGLDKFVNRFNPDEFNPSLTVIENVLFGIRDSNQAPGTRIDPDILSLIEQMNVLEYHHRWSLELLETIVQTFATIGTDHPMFRRLQVVTPESFEELKLIYRKKQRGKTLDEEDLSLAYTLPLGVSAEQLGDAFPEQMQEFLLNGRQSSSPELLDQFSAYYETIHEEKYNKYLTVEENLLFGRVKLGFEREAEKIREVLIRALEAEGLKDEITLLIGDSETGFNGSALPPSANERIAFVRAVMRRPDVLILDRPFANSPPEIGTAMHKNLRALLPDTTIIHLDTDFPADQTYDKKYEVRDGELIDLDAETRARKATRKEDGASSDLNKKLQVLANVELLAKLERRQLRLLAYGAQWIKAKAGEKIFSAGERADGAYVFTEGMAELRWPVEKGGEGILVTEVPPGRMIGDLAVILDSERRMDMIVTQDVKGVRLSNQVLNDVISSDVGVARSLLVTVGDHLQNSADRLVETRRELDGLKEKMGLEVE